MQRDELFDLSRLDTSIDPEEVGYLNFAPVQDLESKETFLSVKIPGDGNCGFYSFAMGLINLIVQDKLAMTDDRYRQFIATLKDEKGAEASIQNRLAFYRTGKAKDAERLQLKKCLYDLKKIYDAFAGGKLATFKNFKAYLLANNAYYPNLAMIIFLGPMLRDLSVKIEKEHKNLNRMEGAGSAAIIEVEAKDGVDADVGQIRLLGSFFDVDLVAYDSLSQGIQRNEKADVASMARGEVKDEKHGERKEEEKKTEHDLATAVDMRRNQIAIAHKPGPHWDCLIPAKDYFAPPFYFSLFSLAEQKGGNQELDRLKEKMKVFKGRLFDFTQAIDKLEAKREQKAPDRVGAAAPEIKREYKRSSEFKGLAVTEVKPENIKKNLITILRVNRNDLFAENEKTMTLAFARCYDALYEAQQILVDHVAEIREVLANLLTLQQEYQPIHIELHLHPEVKAQEVPNAGMKLQINVPADGHCMFYSVAMSFLLPAITDDYLFYTRYKLLFGQAESLADARQLRELLQFYDGNPKFIKKHVEEFKNKVNVPMRKELVKFMKENNWIVPNPDGAFRTPLEIKDHYSMIEEKEDWGGETELSALSAKLRVRITIFDGASKQLKEVNKYGGEYQDEVSLVHVSSEGLGGALNHYNFLIDRKCFSPVVDLDKINPEADKQPAFQTRKQMLIAKIDLVADREFKSALVDLVNDFKDVKSEPFVQHTTEMLDNARAILADADKKPEAKKNEIRATMNAYATSCKATPGYEEAATSIWKVFVTGLATLLAAAVGAGVGFLCAGLGGAVPIAITGAVLGGMVAGYLMFKPRDYQLAEHIDAVVETSQRLVGS